MNDSELEYGEPPRNGRSPYISHNYNKTESSISSDGSYMNTVYNAPGYAGPKATFRRYKTLNRPHLAQPQTPLVHKPTDKSKWSPWRVFSRVVTFWAPDAILIQCGNSMATEISRQAWREKMALLFIAALLWAFIAFYTLVMRNLLCPESASRLPATVIAFDDPYSGKP